MAATAPDDVVHRVVSAALDQAFYRAAYPELAAPGFDPVADYLADGWRQGRDPAPWFSTRGYLNRHHDVAASGVQPLFHYLTAGRREGRDAPPSERGEAYVFQQPEGAAPPAWAFEPAWTPDAARPAGGHAASQGVALSRALAEEADRKAMEADFDVAFYLATYPDIAAAGVDPLTHYMAVGWREGRDPSGRFSTRDYLEIYPDIAAAEINPLLHYVRAGRAEGRSPRSRLGFRYDILARSVPVADRVAAAAEAAEKVQADAVETLQAALAAESTGLKSPHVTFSHDNYAQNIGGLQVCIQREERRAAELDRDHLHLFPAHPWPVLRAGEPGLLGVVLNGRTIGVFSASDVAAALRQAPATEGDPSFALHSLLGHSVDDVLAILDALGLRAGYFWLHDFASLCAGYHLLRNDVQDCAAPPPDSAACQICAYRPWRTRHLAEHQRLFSALDLTVVSPAQPTLDLWRASWSFPHRASRVHPHATLVERAVAEAVPAGPLRVAFAGYPVAHKGWPVFRELVERLSGDPRYAFLHLGGRPAPDVAAEFHHVELADGEAAGAPVMQRELERLAVDVVLIWPLCRETFSFAAYEAVAAGCAIITWPDSGNVAAMVQDGGRGLVLPDEAALIAAFESGEVAALARGRRRPMLYDLAFSGLSLDLAGAAG